MGNAAASLRGQDQGDAVGALLFLTRATFVNRFWAQLRKLSNPRYVIALLLGLGYFWFVLVRPGATPNDGTPRLVTTGVETTAVILALVVMFGAWAFKTERTALAFLPAEVHFLFPGPLTRRGLVGYKLFRSQIVILINALIWTFFLRRGGSALEWPLRLIATWSFFSNLSLHRLGAALVRTSLLEHGRVGARKNLPALAAGAVVIVALGLVVSQLLPEIRATGLENGRQVLQLLREAESTRAAAVILFLPRLVVAPMFSHSAREWLLAIGPAVGMAILQAVWVIRSDVAFEDAAVTASAERVKRLEAIRRRQAAPRISTSARRSAKRTLPLAAVGRPEVAIVWKNTILLMRAARAGSLLSMVAIGAIISVSVAEAQGSGAHLIASFALSVAMMLMLLGARMLQNDMRQDLEHLQTLKTLPLSGTHLVGAEIASAALPLVVMELLLLVVAYVATLNSDRPLSISRSDLTAAVVCAPIVLVALNVMTVTLQNGAALLFPGWVRVGPMTGGGIEMMGQGILATGMLLLAFIIAMLPAAVVGVAVFYFSRALPFAWALALLAGAAVLLAEAWWAITRLGRRFDRMEPAQ